MVSFVQPSKLKFQLESIREINLSYLLNGCITPVLNTLTKLLRIHDFSLSVCLSSCKCVSNTLKLIYVIVYYSMFHMENGVCTINDSFIPNNNLFSRNNLEMMIYLFVRDKQNYSDTLRYTGEKF